MPEMGDEALTMEKEGLGALKDTPNCVQAKSDRGYYSRQEPLSTPTLALGGLIFLRERQQLHPSTISIYPGPSPMPGCGTSTSQLR